MLHGTLLAESLRVGAELRVPDLVVTRIAREDVSASARGTQPRVWTFLEFRAPDERADDLARSLAKALLPGPWYADFEVGDDHVVVFADKVFRYVRGDPTGREDAAAHGRRSGVPEHQLDWAD